MKNYVQYHNFSKQGPLSIGSSGRFYIFAKKSINHLINQRVWVISGHGERSPKYYQLEYTFIVDEVSVGSRNLAQGTEGYKFTPAIELSRQAWFAEFLKQQSNFSLGVMEVADVHTAQFTEFLAPKSGGSIVELFRE